MIAYTTFGTNDLPRAVAFYESLLGGELGAKRVWEGEQGIAWAVDNGPGIGVLKPFDGNTATVGNGAMIAIAAPDKATVDRVHAKALALGGKDEGAVGSRGEHFYAGYFRDLDGNKFAVVFMG